MTDMQPLLPLVAVGLLLGTTAGVLVALPCCGVIEIEPDGFAPSFEVEVEVGVGLGDGLEVAVLVGADTDETCDVCDT